MESNFLEVNLVIFVYFDEFFAGREHESRIKKGIDPTCT